MDDLMARRPSSDPSWRLTWGQATDDQVSRGDCGRSASPAGSIGCEGVRIRIGRAGGERVRQHLDRPAVIRPCLRRPGLLTTAVKRTIVRRVTAMGT